MATTVFNFTLNGGNGKWSRYTFPFSIQAFAQLGDVLYIRNGDIVSRVSESAVTDDVEGIATNFVGKVHWPWLDFGQPGVTKTLLGLDVVASGTPSVSIGFDQRDTGVFTTPYVIPSDTLPGGFIPMPVSAPTMSVKLTFAGGEAWSLNSVNLYLKDQKVGS